MAFTTTAFFIPEINYFNNVNTSIAATATYIETEHDAIDGYDSANEQRDSFLEFFINRVGALVSATEDSLTGNPVPARDPNKISLQYYLDKVTPNDRETWLFRIRWGNIDTYSKEFYWKRVMRMILHQERDGDMPQMLRRTGYGLWHWYNQPVGTPPIAEDVRFSLLRPYMGVTATSTAWTSTTSQLTTKFRGPVGTTYTEQQMKDIFNSFIVYKTNGRLVPNVNLTSIISYSGYQNVGAASPNQQYEINIIFDLSTTNNATSGITVQEILDHSINGVYAIYDRLAFEISDDADNATNGPIYDTGGPGDTWFAASAPFDTIAYQD